MKSTCYFKFILFIGLFFGLNLTSFAQIFNWYSDGFAYNQTNYFNIDGSGIDIEVSGMGLGIPEWGGPYVDWVKLGIDDNGMNNVQHIYTIKFSQTVDVAFEIGNINWDTVGLFCYNDQLVIPNAQIVHSSMITSNFDTIFASWGEASSTGWVSLKYLGIDSLVVIHGEGANCNPGHIFISPLIINGNRLDIAENEKISTKKLIRIVDVMGNDIAVQANKLLIYIYSDGSTEKVFIKE